jgi:hypothetical protein
VSGKEVPNVAEWMLRTLTTAIQTSLTDVFGRMCLVPVTRRIIPATACAVGYPLLVVRFVDLINTIGASVGPQAIAGLFVFPPAQNAYLLLLYVVLWMRRVEHAVARAVLTARVDDGPPRDDLPILLRHSLEQ